MIDWSDPDYQSAGGFQYSGSKTRLRFGPLTPLPTQGHFYALVKSVTVKCANPQTANANTTSYVYQNSSSPSKPSIALSNRSTLLNAAPVVGVSGMHRMIVVLMALFLAFVHLF
jgi:hypothetical protein